MLRLLPYEGLIDKRYIMNKIHKDTDIDWQKKSQFIFYWPRRMKVLQGIVFDQFHRSRIEYKVYSDELQDPKLHWSPLLNFNISCLSTTSSFLRLSINVHTFGWNLKILLLNLLFYRNILKVRRKSKHSSKEHLSHSSSLSAMIKKKQSVASLHTIKE